MRAFPHNSLYQITKKVFFLNIVSMSEITFTEKSGFNCIENNKTYVESFK